MKIAFLAGMLVTAISSHAVPLKGKVVNNQGMPVASANVLAVTANISGATDANGEFTLDLPTAISQARMLNLKVGQGYLAFNVVQHSAWVRITVRDFKGRMVATAQDGRLSRGRYSLAPLALKSARLPTGVYICKVEIGDRAMFQKIAHMEKNLKPGLRFEPLEIRTLAKAAGLGTDTLMVSLAGYQSETREIVVVPDSLPDIILYPNGYARGSRTDDQPYVIAKVSGMLITPLLTVGESVKLTSDTAQSYRMIGIPDGMGAYDAGGGRVGLFLNHEVRNTAVTHPVSIAPKNGSFISHFLLSKPDGGILSGDFAFTSVKVGDGTTDTVGVFNRFCSGNVSGPEVGLTQPIYFAGEETGTGGFGNKGGEGVAVVGGTARLLNDLGRMAFENIVVAPVANAATTVVFALEDGPIDSCQLYMYVGTKNGSASGVLERNGLIGGRLYAFKSSDTSKNNEAQFTTGTLSGTWVEITGASSKTGAQLENDSRAAGAFVFDRIEDGTYDRNTKGAFYFVTTGGSARNPHGRLYKLTFDPANPTGGTASVEMLKAGGPGSFSAPDNMDANADGQIMINEDPTDSSFAVLRTENRNATIWLYDIPTRIATRVAELNENAVPPSLRNTANIWWETSGIIDASALYGRGAWLVDVQAHSINAANAAALQGLPSSVGLGEGGQLLLIKMAGTNFGTLGNRTDDPSYVRSVRDNAAFTPLFTVGESTKLTSDTAQGYRMIGIPDGMGAYDAGGGRVGLFLNHEVRNTAVTHPVSAAPKNGSFISHFLLSKPEGGILSGDFAFTSVKVGDGTTDTVGMFNRFCSGNVSGPEAGLTQPIYFAGEETGTGGFGNKGGEGVAVVGGAARLLPDLGRMAFENIVVAPVTNAATTVVFALEDGPIDSSQLYMYVGTKNGSASGILERNGLIGGRLYAFRSSDTTKNNEAQYATGILSGTWVEITNVAAKTATQLETDTRAAGAFIFDRIEDGTYDRNTKGIFYFVTTGGSPRNPHGRLYKLSIDTANPAGGTAALEMLKAGGPGSFLAPDNMDANADGQIMINEDPTDSSFAVLRAENRNASIWMYDIASGNATRLGEIDEAAVPVPMRNQANTWWETSGIIDASALYGRGAWLVDVQAHSINAANAAALQGLPTSVGLGEGGQLLLMRVK